MIQLLKEKKSESFTEPKLNLWKDSERKVNAMGESIGKV